MEDKLLELNINWQDLQKGLLGKCVSEDKESFSVYFKDKGLYTFNLTMKDKFTIIDW